jgi:hypothetical protein
MVHYRRGYRFLGSPQRSEPATLHIVITPTRTTLSLVRYFTIITAWTFNRPPWAFIYFMVAKVTPLKLFAAFITLAIYNGELAFVTEMKVNIIQASSPFTPSLIVTAIHNEA